MSAAALAVRPADHIRMQIQSKINRLKVEIGNLAANQQRAQEGYRCKTVELRRLEAELAMSLSAPARASFE